MTMPDILDQLQSQIKEEKCRYIKLAKGLEVLEPLPFMQCNVDEEAYSKLKRELKTIENKLNKLEHDRLLIKAQRYGSICNWRDLHEGISFYQHKWWMFRVTSEGFKLSRPNEKKVINLKHTEVWVSVVRNYKYACFEILTTRTKLIGTKDYNLILLYAKPDADLLHAAHPYYMNNPFRKS